MGQISELFFMLVMPFFFARLWLPEGKRVWRALCRAVFANEEGGSHQPEDHDRPE